MKPESNHRLLAAIALTGAAIASTASAAPTVAGETNNDVGFTVSATDLLQTSVAATTNNISVNGPENNAIGGSAALLTDGSFGAVGASGGICINGGSITYELSTPVGSPGYDISEIRVHTGWNDEGRDGQNYTVSYSTVGAPATFIEIATVTRDESGRFEKTTITESAAPTPLASGVKAIRIAFNSQENGGVGYKEIDVIGNSPVPTPRNLVWNGAASAVWNTTDSNWTGSIWENTRPDNAFFTTTGGFITLETITAGSVNAGNTGINFPFTALGGGSLNAASLTVQGFANNGGGYGSNPTLSVDSAVTLGGDAAIGRANLEITGGTFTANRIISAPASADWGRLVVSGGTVTATNGVDGSVNTGATFAIDLNGGELRAPSVRVANRELGTNNNASLIFNGGTLTAIGADNPNFITTYGGGQNAYVGSGGAILNTNGFNIGIQVNLLNGGGGGLIKEGAGTLTLGGANTYVGDTTVNAGTLVLADNAQLRFVVNDNPAANVVTGTGAAIFNGDFVIDTAAVSGNSGFIWTLVDRATLNGESFDAATFSVVGFSDVDDDGVWTMTDAKGDWSFSEATGELTLDVGNDYDDWGAPYGLAQGSEAGDLDNDGLTNQQEYAFGLIPDSGASVNPIVVPLDKATGTFRYTRRATPATTGLTYTVWTSTDLTTWTEDTTATASQTVIGTVGEVQTVEATISGSLPLAQPKLFVQVRAN